MARSWEKPPWRGWGRDAQSPAVSTSHCRMKKGPPCRNQRDVLSLLSPWEDWHCHVFRLLFSPTEPLGAEASTDNSDHLILNKVFLAGNWILYFPPNLVRGAYPHISWAEHWARLAGRGAEVWRPFSASTLSFRGHRFRPTTGPRGTSRTLSFAGQSLHLGDFQATSWGECLGGEWPAGRILIDRRRGGGQAKAWRWEDARHFQWRINPPGQAFKPSAKEWLWNAQAIVKKCVQVVGVGRPGPRAKRPSLTMLTARPPSTEPRENLVVGLGAEGSPALCRPPGASSLEKGRVLTLKSHLFHHLHPFGRRASVTSDLSRGDQPLPDLSTPAELFSSTFSTHTAYRPPALTLLSGFPGPSGPDVVMKPSEALFPCLSRVMSCHMKLPRYGVAVSLQHI